MKIIARLIVLLFLISVVFTAFTGVSVFAGGSSGVDQPGSGSSGSGSGGGYDLGLSPSDITKIDPHDVTDVKQGVNKLGGSFWRYATLIGTIAAVVILSVFGIQWFLATPQQKALLKEKAWVYVIGALFMFGAGKIMEILANTFQNIKPTG